MARDLFSADDSPPPQSGRKSNQPKQGRNKPPREPHRNRPGTPTESAVAEFQPTDAEREASERRVAQALDGPREEAPATTPDLATGPSLIIESATTTISLPPEEATPAPSEVPPARNSFDRAPTVAARVTPNPDATAKTPPAAEPVEEPRVVLSESLKLEPILPVEPPPQPVAQPAPAVEPAQRASQLPRPPTPRPFPPPASPPPSVVQPASPSMRQMWCSLCEVTVSVHPENVRCPVCKRYTSLMDQRPSAVNEPPTPGFRPVEPAERLPPTTDQAPAANRASPTATTERLGSNWPGVILIIGTIVAVGLILLLGIPVGVAIYRHFYPMPTGEIAGALHDSGAPTTVVSPPPAFTDEDPHRPDCERIAWRDIAVSATEPAPSANSRSWYDCLHSGRVAVNLDGSENLCACRLRILRH